MSLRLHKIISFKKNFLMNYSIIRKFSFTTYTFNDEHDYKYINTKTISTHFFIFVCF